MDFWRRADGAAPAVIGGRLLVGGLLAVSLFALATGCHAEQSGRPQDRGSSIPSLDSLPHDPLPSGRFLGWCGDKTIVEVGERQEIYSGAIKASPLSFASNSKLICGDDSAKLLFDDHEGGRISEVDIAGGIVTRTLATYDKVLYRDISFSPDLKHIASNHPLTLASSTVDTKVIELKEQRGFWWRRDSSEVFSISAPGEKYHPRLIEIFDAQGQRIGSGPLPAGFDFRDGWFAASRALYLYLVPSSDEFGAGVVFRCPIEVWKCAPIARNVLEVSVGGNGILAMVRAVGKYSNDGETERFPPRYLVDIRNGASQVVAMQRFESGERDSFAVAVSPSGTKLALTWLGKNAPGCPSGEQENAPCRGGIVIDLSGRLK